MNKTLVLVIDYPSEMRERLEEKLKPLVLDVNLNYGEVWQPYDGPTDTELIDILDNLRDNVLQKQIAKTKAIEERMKQFDAKYRSAKTN